MRKKLAWFFPTLTKSPYLHVSIQIDHLLTIKHTRCRLAGFRDVGRWNLIALVRARLDVSSSARLNQPIASCCSFKVMPIFPCMVQWQNSNRLRFCFKPFFIIMFLLQKVLLQCRRDSQLIML